VRIEPLADRPDAIRLLAEWFHAEWHVYDGRSRDEIERQLGNNLRRDALPITFIATAGAEVIGTVSLDESDLPSHDHLSPWLASLYVVPSHRRAGVARALINHLVAFADSKGIASIYLWTPGSTELYERFGWTRMESVLHGRSQIVIMERRAAIR
jgi:predicted N-acetyltransferase YhbS